MFSVVPFECMCAKGTGGKVAAVISYVRGRVNIKRPSSKVWVSAKSGSFLYEGDEIRTRTRSRAVVTFNNGVETKLYSNTRFTVQAKEITKKKKPGNSIKIAFGRIWTRVLKQKTKFDIHTPVATISVRGTKYETNVAAKGGRTTVKVFSGVVEMGNKFGKVKITKDSKSSCDAGSAPMPPAEMTKDDVPTWQDADELKTSGTLDMELKSEDALTDEAVEGKVIVNDSDGKIDKAFKSEISVGADSKDAELSLDGTSWSSSVKSKPSDGVLVFYVKAKSKGTVNVSASADGVGGSMVSFEVKLIPKKNLKINIQDSEGNKKELLLKFKAK